MSLAPVKLSKGAWAVRLRASLNARDGARRCARALEALPEQDSYTRDLTADAWAHYREFTADIDTIIDGLRADGYDPDDPTFCD